MGSQGHYEAPTLTVLGSVETLTQTGELKYYGGNDGVMFGTDPNNAVPIGPVSSVTP